MKSGAQFGEEEARNGPIEAQGRETSGGSIGRALRIGKKTR